jgi:hypothetical protein
LSFTIESEFDEEAGSNYDADIELIIASAHCYPSIQEFNILNPGSVFHMSPSIDALVSIPNLRRLEIEGCTISVNSFSRFKKLTDISIDSCLGDGDMALVLRSIGKRLVSLEIDGCSDEIVRGVIENCPNLRNLVLHHGSWCLWAVSMLRNGLGEIG